jgi:hypothetical protein
MVAAPLLLVRQIQKFAFTFILADILILFTVSTIIVYALLHFYKEAGYPGENL